MKRLLIFMISALCLACTKQMEQPSPTLPEGTLWSQPSTKAEGISIYLYQHDGATLVFGGEIADGEMWRYTDFYTEIKLLEASDDAVTTDKGVFSFDNFQIEWWMIEERAEKVTIEAPINDWKLEDII